MTTPVKVVILPSATTAEIAAASPLPIGSLIYNTTILESISTSNMSVPSISADVSVITSSVTAPLASNITVMPAAPSANVNANSATVSGASGVGGTSSNGGFAKLSGGNGVGSGGGAGGYAYISGGASAGLAAGGAVTIVGGASALTPGPITITAGSGNGIAAPGANVTISAGGSLQGASGILTINGGVGSGSGGNGGDLVLHAGNGGTLAQGGNVYIRAGTVTSGGPGKVIQDIGLFEMTNLIGSQMLGLDSSKNISNMVIPGMISGFSMSYTSATTVTISSGYATNSTNTFAIQKSSSVLVNIANVGVVNGLDTGTFAPFSWYYVYVIGDSNGVNAIGGLFSVSSTSPTLPSGYNVFRRIGAVKSTSTLAFNEFYYKGEGIVRTCTYTTSIGNTLQLLNGSATSFATVGLGGSIPATSQSGILSYSFSPASTGDPLYIRPTGNTTTAANSLIVISDGNNLLRGQTVFVSNSSRQIDYQVGSGTASLAVLAFDDIL